LEPCISKDLENWESIILKFPSDLPEDVLKDHLNKNFEEFKGTLDMSVGVVPYDARLTIHDVCVESLENREDEVLVNYTINWSYYAGCEDKNGGCDEESYVRADRRGHALIFQPYVPSHHSHHTKNPKDTHFHSEKFRLFLKRLFMIVALTPPEL
jgi:hypothetical protein